MANGAAALALLPPAGELPADAKVIANPPAALVSELEHRVGILTADAAVAIAYGMSTYAADGQLNDLARAAGGDSLGKLAQIHLDSYGEIDFATVALTQGQRILLQRHAVALRQQLVPNLPPAALEKAAADLVSMAVTIAETVAQGERAYVKAQTN